MPFFPIFSAAFEAPSATAALPTAPPAIGAAAFSWESALITMIEVSSSKPFSAAAVIILSTIWLKLFEFFTISQIFSSETFSQKVLLQIKKMSPCFISASE